MNIFRIACLLWIMLTSASLASPRYKLCAQGETRVVSAIAWKPDGSVFAVEYFEGTVELRDGATGNLQQIIDEKPPHNSIDILTWHPTANLLLNGSTGLLYLWDLSADVSYDLSAIANDSIRGMRSVFWDADGKRAIALNDDLMIWDVQTLPPQFLSKTRISRETYVAEWNPNRTIVATRAMGDVFLRDPVDFEWFAAASLSGDGVLAWCPDGQWLAASGWSGMIRTWNVATGEFQQERVIQSDIFEQNPYPYNTTLALQFSADGTELLSVDVYGTFKQWDAHSRQLLQVTQLADMPLSAAAFSPDGTQIVYGPTTGDLVIIPIPEDSTRISITPTMRMSQDEFKYQLAGTPQTQRSCSLPRPNLPVAGYGDQSRRAPRP